MNIKHMKMRQPLYNMKIKHVFCMLLRTIYSEAVNLVSHHEVMLVCSTG